MVGYYGGSVIGCRFDIAVDGMGFERDGLADGEEMIERRDASADCHYLHLLKVIEASATWFTEANTSTSSLVSMA